MTLRRDSRLVEFDADAAVDAVLDVAGPDVRVCTEYTMEALEVLYFANELVDGAICIDSHLDVAASMHSYAHVDFTERELFEDHYPGVSEAYAFATFTDRAAVIRVLADGEGLYVALVPDAAVTPVVQAVRDVIA